MLDMERAAEGDLNEACEEAAAKANATGIDEDKVLAITNECKSDGLSTITDQKKATQDSFYNQCLSVVEAEVQALGNKTVDTWAFAKDSAERFLSNKSDEFEKEQASLSSVIKSKAAKAKAEAKSLWASFSKLVSSTKSAAEAKAAAVAAAAKDAVANTAADLKAKAASAKSSVEATAADLKAKASAAAASAKSTAESAVAAAKQKVADAAKSAAAASAKDTVDSAFAGAQKVADVAKWATSAEADGKDSVEGSQKLFLQRSMDFSTENKGAFSIAALAGLGLLSVVAFAVVVIRGQRQSYRAALALDSDASDGVLLE